MQLRKGEIVKLDSLANFEDLSTFSHEVTKNKFGKGKKVNKTPFPKITYKESLNKYGTDKPDLRNPIELADVTNLFSSDQTTLKIFIKPITKYYCRP